MIFGLIGVSTGSLLQAVQSAAGTVLKTQMTDRPYFKVHFLGGNYMNENFELFFFT